MAYGLPNFQALAKESVDVGAFLHSVAFPLSMAALAVMGKATPFVCLPQWPLSHFGCPSQEASPTAVHYMLAHG